jgi:hypothetical protein
VRDGARREYAEELRGRYALASRKEKGRILDEYCRTTHVHRKAAIRTLHRVRADGGRRPGRPRRYSAALSPVLAELWELSGRLSGKLLVPVLPLLLPALERHRGRLLLAPAQRALVLGLSAATLDPAAPAGAAAPGPAPPPGAPGRERAQAADPHSHLE